MFPPIPGPTPPRAANDVTPLPDWTDPKPTSRSYGPLVPQVGPDGNEWAELYPTPGYSAATVRAAAESLLRDRLLLAEDAAAYEAATSSHP